MQVRRFDLMQGEAEDAEMFQRPNGEYVLGDDYDDMVTEFENRISDLEHAIRSAREALDV